MTETKHTPGEYHVHPCDWDESAHIHTRYIDDEGCTEHYIVATCPIHPKIDKATADANARFFARAPQMLAALKDLLDQPDLEHQPADGEGERDYLRCKWCYYAFNANCRNDLCPNDDCPGRIARALVAEAEGK